MTPLHLILDLALCFPGLAALALSRNRHHRDAFAAPVSPGRAATLRIGGWTLLALSLAAAVALEGWNFGPVQWVGTLTGSGLLVVGLLSYRPTWLRPAAILALPLALALLPGALR